MSESTAGDPLLEPFQLRHLTLRNRVMSTAHEPAYSDDGMPGERYVRYHVEKAKGGLALTMTAGSALVAEDSPPAFGNLRVVEAALTHALLRAFEAGAAGGGVRAVGVAEAFLAHVRGRAATLRRLVATVLPGEGGAAAGSEEEGGGQNRNALVHADAPWVVELGRSPRSAHRCFAVRQR